MRAALIVGLCVLALLVHSVFAAILAQPWAAFWFGQQSVAITDLPTGGPDIPRGSGPVGVVTLPTGGAAVDDLGRARLAIAAGFHGDDMVTAVAVSIAEDGSGNPAALSPRNDNGTYDLGLWQVNSTWWAQFGGPQALVDPATNARAAFVIHAIQGWCAWSTYEAYCGRGHTGSYAGYLGRARAAVQRALQPTPIPTPPGNIA